MRSTQGWRIQRLISVHTSSLWSFRSATTGSRVKLREQVCGTPREGVCRWENGNIWGLFTNDGNASNAVR